MKREPESFAALEQAWTAWDATMLPLDPKAFTHGASGANSADHYGVAASDD